MFPLLIRKTGTIELPPKRGFLGSKQEVKSRWKLRKKEREKGNRGGSINK